MLMGGGEGAPICFLLEEKEMNTKRFIAAVIGVWIVRVALNATFYGGIMAKRSEEMSAAHPGMFREVIPAYIATDLIFALVFVFLFAKVGSAVGGGAKAGVTLGVLVAILSPVIGSLYQYFSVTYLTAGLLITESVFQLVAHAIEGAVAGLIYKDLGSALSQEART